MEISSSSTHNMDPEPKAILGLVETFGSFFSREEITSAYRNAGRNTELASQILSFSEPRTNGGYPDSVLHTKKPLTRGNKEYRYVSRGTVSRDNGKDDKKPPTKPLRIDEMPIPTCDPYMNSGVPNSDMELFTRKTLGDGLKLDDDATRQAFVQCGFDVQKGMESVDGLSTETSISKEKPIPSGNLDSQNAEDFPSKNNLSKEILHSLFKGPNQVEKVKLTRLPRRQKTRSIALGKLVTSTFDSDEEEPSITPSICDQDVAIADEADDTYISILNVRKEYRSTMKEYYESAINAFMKGDTARAERLMEKGQFYSSKAREAAEESEQMIFNPRGNSEERSELLLDLHSHDAKQAVSLLKLHLSSVSSFDVLKVVIEKDGEIDASKGARARLVRKFLEKKEVQWRDGENGGTIFIELCDKKIMS